MDGNGIGFIVIVLYKTAKNFQDDNGESLW